ncbi:MAG: methionyl-tRNA formyltransferase, partial [Proteobacteria bacterium]|nr:methionyl-tRNA formyltransferase [Pseudomonadota bacterium]
VTDGSGKPGTVLDDTLTVACGEGAIRLEVVQRGGKGAMEAAAFLRGRAIPAGTKLV